MVVLLIIIATLCTTLVPALASAKEAADKTKTDAVAETAKTVAVASAKATADKEKAGAVTAATKAVEMEKTDALVEHFHDQM